MMAPTRRVAIDARPEMFTIEPAQTAVVVVDMQNDFGSDGGMMARAGIDISGNKAVIPATVRVLAAARKADILVVYLKMAFRATSPTQAFLILPTGLSICHYAQVKKQ